MRDLPSEIIAAILANLPPEDLLRARLLGLEFKDIIDDPYFIAPLHKLHFPELTHQANQTFSRHQFKEAYQQTYLRQAPHKQEHLPLMHALKQGDISTAAAYIQAHDLQYFDTACLANWQYNQFQRVNLIDLIFLCGQSKLFDLVEWHFMETPEAHQQIMTELCLDTVHFRKFSTHNSQALANLPEENLLVLAHVAIGSDNINALKTILPHLATSTISKDAGKALAKQAIANNSDGMDKILEEILKATKIHKGRKWVSLFKKACIMGNPKMINTLIKQCTDVNANSKSYETPLAIACSLGLTDAVDKLLSLGANPDLANGETQTPLICACKAGSLEIVQLLLKHGANVDGVNGNNECAFLFACSTGNADIANELIAHGADVTITNIDGLTPLQLAVHTLPEEFTQRLIDLGADVNAQSNTQTPLHNAAYVSRISSIKSLLEHGADIHARTSTGKNALLIACRRSSLETVLCLLEAGADPNVVANNGSTALMAACDNIDERVSQYFLDHDISYFDTKVTDDVGKFKFSQVFREFNQDLKARIAIRYLEDFIADRSSEKRHGDKSISHAHALLRTIEQGDKVDAKNIPADLIDVHRFIVDNKLSRPKPQAQAPKI